MLKNKKISVFTCSRSDFGILTKLCDVLEKKKNINFHLLVAGTHFSKKFGFSYKEIISRKYKKKCRVERVQGPRRDVWADPEYTVNEMARQESNRQLKRELSMCTVSKPEKVQKVDPAPKEEPGPAPKTMPSKFTDKQSKILETEKTKARELLKKVKLTNHKANLPELVEEIMKRDRDPLKKSEITLVSMMATLAKSIESGSGDYKELKKNLKNQTKEIYSLFGHYLFFY